MKNRNLLALAILGGLLTACGGSDDNNSNNPSDPNGEKPLRGPSPGLQYQHWIDPTDTDGSHGISDSNGNPQGGNNNGGNNNGGNNNGGNNGNNGGNNNRSPSYNEIEFNGKIITLLPPNVPPGSGDYYENNDGAYRKMIGNQFGNLIFGVIVDKANGNARAFTRDTRANALTTNMPTTGTFDYGGTAVHYDVARKEFLKGTALMKVDFSSAKKLTGEINLPGRTDPVRLSADIIGNRFSGSSDNQVVTSGSFYGDEATEMGGIYGKNTSNPDVKEFIGSFGAKKRAPFVP